MATSESDFKSGFKRDLQAAYPEALIWSMSDKFRPGLPDFAVSWDHDFFAIEAKFVKDLPAYTTSKALRHELSAPQIEFLIKNRANRNVSLLLIGLPDVAVVVYEIKQNYTVTEVTSGRRITRIKGKWDIQGFLEEMREWRG